MHLHVISVGTSILRNFVREPRYAGLVERYGMVDWGRLSPADERQRRLEGLKRGDEVYDALLEFVDRDPVRASAELNAFYGFMDLRGQLDRGGVRVMVYSTDTENGWLCARIIYDHLRGAGFRVLGEPVRVRGLGTGLERLEEGLVNLLDRVVRLIADWSRRGHRVYINATAGYKPETGFMIIASMLAGATAAYYIHESFREPIEIPLLPLTVREGYAALAEFFREPRPIRESEDWLASRGLSLGELTERGILEIDYDRGLVATRRWVEKLIEVAGEGR